MIDKRYINSSKNTIGNQTRNTDIGNARRLVNRHGDDLRYVSGWGWLHYDGKRWQRDETGETVRRAKDTVGQIYREAAGHEDMDSRQRLIGWAKTSESESKIRAMISLAQSEEKVAARVADFDTAPWLFNCMNGTIDLKTGQLRRHEKADLITKLSPVRQTSLATCPTWLGFLERVLPSPEVRRYVQKVVGYCLTGDVSEQELYFAHGGGANGKSTFVNTLLHVIGDYGKQAAPDLLVLQRGDSRHPTELADLLGARFVASVEIEEGRRLAEALVKQMTGGDPIKARHMRQDFFQFVPTHKIFFAANHKPTVHGTDYAIWRRIRLIPFTVSIPLNEQDKTLSEKLRAEASGILAWAVEGCLLWQEEGLMPPRDVAHATESYRTEMDTLGRFISECCTVGPGERVSARNFYEAYTEWCAVNFEQAESQKTIGRSLAEKGFESRRSGPNGSTEYHGLWVLL